MGSVRDRSCDEIETNYADMTRFETPHAKRRIYGDEIDIKMTKEQAISFLLKSYPYREFQAVSEELLDAMLISEGFSPDEVISEVKLNKFCESKGVSHASPHTS